MHKRYFLELECCNIRPISTSEKLSKHEGGFLNPENSTWYRSIVGALQYLTLTRMDLDFLVNKVWQFLHAPMTVNRMVVKRIFRYVKHTLDLGLSLLKSKAMLLNVFSDAD